MVVPTEKQKSEEKQNQYLQNKKNKLIYRD